MSAPRSSTSGAPRVVAVAGGKGGAGKSLLAANIGIFLATLGKRVVLVDAALGGANLHIFVGVQRPTRTLAECLGKEERPLGALVEDTPVPGLRLVSGMGDPVWVANPKGGQVRRLIDELRTLEADYVVVDIATGTQTTAIDIFLSADVGVLVAVPEPTSVELTYRFMRAAFLRHLRARGLGELARLPAEELRRFEGGIPSPLDLYLRALATEEARADDLRDAILGFSPHLVVNSARSKADMELGRAVASAARRRLGLPITYLGHLEYDEAVWVAIRRRRPLLVEHPESRVSKCLEKVTRRLLATRESESHPTSVMAGDSHYELMEIAPTASFEDIRRANRRIRDVYAPDSVVVSGLYAPEGLEALHRRFDVAYTTLMDAAKRKEYDQELFPDGIHAPSAERVRTPPPERVEAPPVERPPMPELDEATVYTGALLQHVREARGIDLREIAERTKIGMGYLQSLESETFKKLPAAVYVRGFLVEYSKILGLDVDRVLETYLSRYRAARLERMAREEDTLS